MTDALSAGSIAFTGYSYDRGTAFNFVALADIQAGQVITFTDNNHYDGQASTDESVWTWTAGQNIAAGTVVTLENLTTPAFDPSQSPTSNLGTVTAQYGSSTEFSNEVIFAYTGTADNPIYLAAFSSYAFTDIDRILAGTGLQDGFGSVSMGTVGNGAVIAAYQGPTSGFSSFDDYKAALFNAANWASQSPDYSGATDPAHDGVTPDGPLSTAPFTVDPSVQTLGFAQGSRAVSVNEGQPGDANVITFTITRSGSTTGALDFHGVLSFAADSGIDAADFGGTLPTFAGTIPDGASSVQVTIPVSADIRFENDEKFTVTLDGGSNAAAPVVIGGSNTATATIVNDDQVQTIRFADDSQNLQVTEGDSGLKTITFTVVRDGGGTLGDVTFTVAYDGGIAGADDFGGTLPTTFTGVIPDGQSSATFSLQIAGDTTYEADDYFGLSLVSVNNDPVGAVIAPAYAGGSVTVTIVNDDAQPTSIGSGEVAQGQIVITGQDHFTIASGGLLAVNVDSAFLWTGSDTDAVIDNAGTVHGGGAGLAVDNPTGHLTVENREGGQFLDGLNFNGLRAGATVTINNAGAMGGGNFYAVQFSDSGAAITLNNLATGVISAPTNQPGSDVLKNGSNFTINNWGRIVSPADIVNDDGSVQYGGDAIDISHGTNDVVHNYAGGLIEGSRHGITGDRGFTAINELGATITGRNGSALNFDNNADPSRALKVTNYGTLLGLSQGYPDSDGDAIDADGLALIDNYGMIRGEGANGYHNGEANVSEGIAIGGGTINNYAGAVIYGYGRAIQVDDSSNGAAFSSTIIDNAGIIEGGGNGPANVAEEDAALFAARLKGGEAIDILGDFADTITNSGGILGGVRTGGGDDAMTNTGLVVAMAGSAIDLGDGNDTFTNSGIVSGDVLMGAGDDTINLATGSTVWGIIDGGDGNDTLNLSGTGTLGKATGIETVDVQGGIWAINSDATYSHVTIESGAGLVVRGTVSDVKVKEAAELSVYGSSNGATVLGEQVIQTGGVATDTTIGAGGEQRVINGAAANGTTIEGGTQYVFGTADDTTIDAAGLQHVNGSATDTIVNAGGEQNVYAGATATGTTLNAGGIQIDWGNAVATTIDGGNQYVYGTAADTVVLSGTQYIEVGGATYGTMIGDGGTVHAFGGGSVHNATFAGSDATLVLDHAADFSGFISGWQDGNHLDLADIQFGQGTTVAYAANASNSGGKLTVSDGAHTVSLSLLGQYTAADFALAGDGHGGTVITDPGTQVQNQLAAHA